MAVMPVYRAVLSALESINTIRWMVAHWGHIILRVQHSKHIIQEKFIFIYYTNEPSISN